MIRLGVLLALPLVYCASAAESCPPRAVCFSGRVEHGQAFRRAINQDLYFELRPGWTIAIAPAHPEGECTDLAWVVNPPYRAHGALYIDASYGWTAAQEIAYSPREFAFVTNCADYRKEAARVNIVLWPYTASQKEYEDAAAKLGSSPQGKARMWITGSETGHTAGKPDRIEWLAFRVEIRLPR